MTPWKLHIMGIFPQAQIEVSTTVQVPKKNCRLRVETPITITDPKRENVSTIKVVTAETLYMEIRWTDARAPPVDDRESGSKSRRDKSGADVSRQTVYKLLVFGI